MTPTEMLIIHIAQLPYYSGINMKFFIFLPILAALCSAAYDPMSYVDRPCGADISNLWLDVVVLVDNSQEMTDRGLASVAATVSSTFSQGTRIGTGYSDPRSTRIGLVTYNFNATVQADLNKFKNMDDVTNGVFSSLNKVADTYESYLSKGLATAYQVLKDGQRIVDRPNFKQVILVFAASYQGNGPLDPLPVARRLQATGIDIITVAYNQDGDPNLEKKLAQISGPNGSFSFGVSSVGDLQMALLRCNCFCPYYWIQYRASYSEKNSTAYGTCIQLVDLAAYWRAAQMQCRNRQKNSYLVTEFNQQKHNFILDAVKGSGHFGQPYTYHIGLNMVSGKWVWDQPLNWPQPLLQNYTNWSNGYPIGSSSMSAVQNVQSGYKTFWKNVGYFTDPAGFVCETYACDSDNYCDDLNV